MIVKQLNDSGKKKSTSFQLKAGNLITAFMDKKNIAKDGKFKI